MPFLDAPTPVAFAHRGGALLPRNLGIENTVAAFRAAVELGFRYLETDVHRSRDGVVYAFHDEDLSRVTGRAGLIRELDSSEIDAARIGEREPIPRLTDLLEQFPEARFNVDLKADDVVEAAVDVLREHQAVDRVCLASFSHARLALARTLLPGVVSALSPAEIGRLKAGLPWAETAGVCVQVPIRRGPVRLVTRGFISRAHRHGLQVHVWTVDSPRWMHELLDLGVDGLMTDRPDLLRAVLEERGQWV